MLLWTKFGGRDTSESLLENYYFFQQADYDWSKSDFAITDASKLGTKDDGRDDVVIYLADIIRIWLKFCVS